MHILVTGGGGYIGSILVRHLLALNYKITVVDRFYFGELTLPHHPGLVRLCQDTRSISLAQLVGVDAVIDLAAISNDPAGERFQALTEAVNVQARIRTARLARQAAVKRYILPSSCSVYGNQHGLMDEASQTSPLTTYARANLSAEQGILALQDDRFSVVALRLPTVFGYSPRMRLDLVVNAMIYSAWQHSEITIHGNGLQNRPLIHVRDVSDALACVLHAPAESINGHVFNIGSEALNLRVKDIASQVQQAYEHISGCLPRVTYEGTNDARSYAVNFSKVRALLGWQPAHTIAGATDELISRLNAREVRTGMHCYTLDWYIRVLDSDVAVSDTSEHAPLDYAS
ncbi:MAG: SDR family oxidoreductase [Alcanivorax sp.]|nr:SDR family oxidoreductase [Alcanivorax sp.]